MLVYNTIDYLLEHKDTIKTKKGALMRLETLWPVVLTMGELFVADRADGKGGIPDLGDVYPSTASQFNNPQSPDHYVPFHKMSQWLVYSIIEPMERLLGATIEGTELLTPLPEFRNGRFLFLICLFIFIIIIIVFCAHPGNGKDIFFGKTRNGNG